MWINPMLSIWLYGSILALVACGISLAIWYRK